MTLKGAKDCVAGARKRIEELVMDLECQVTIECVIEQQHHRTVMGPRGAHVQKICKDFDVQIKIPDRKAPATGEEGEVNGGDHHAEADIIRISGKKEKCDAAAQALKELVPINIEVSIFLFFKTTFHEKKKMMIVSSQLIRNEKNNMHSVPYLLDWKKTAFSRHFFKFEKKTGFQKNRFLFENN